MDLVTMVLHQNAVGNFRYQLMLVVVHLVAPQNLGELNQGAHLSCQVVVHLVVERPRLVVFVVDAELRHLLKMDCCQVSVDLDEVDAELRHQLKMDCCLDEASQELEVLE
jgi:hypothetical protein